MTQPANQSGHFAPLERIAVPAMLDGSHGSNRSTSKRAQIAAGNDVDAT